MGGAVAVAVAGGLPHRAGGPQGRREAAPTLQPRASRQVRANHALDKGLRQAPDVRETCSEKPVSRHCTGPSDNSRKTWGMR